MTERAVLNFSAVVDHSLERHELDYLMQLCVLDLERGLHRPLTTTGGRMERVDVRASFGMQPPSTSTSPSAVDESADDGAG